MRYFYPILIWVLVVLCASSTPASERPTAAEAFATLASLVGDWESRVEGGGAVKINYKLVSNGSALVETFTTRSGKETLSVYHLDGPRLIYTHYCAQGNQPRLVLDGSSSDASTLRFEYLDATGLDSPGESHMVALELSQVDTGSFRESYTYRSGESEDAETLLFVKVDRP